LVEPVTLSNSHLSGSVIVVVDDDEGLRELFELILGASEATVVATGDPTNAEELIADTQPDVVLLDVDMPACDGLEVARRLKANPLTTSIPFMFVTGADMDRGDASNAGAAGVVPKPFDPLALESAIDGLLEDGRVVLGGARRL
jgi:CheY-like chemotaxis protein